MASSSRVMPERDPVARRRSRAAMRFPAAARSGCREAWVGEGEKKDGHIFLGEVTPLSLPRRGGRGRGGGGAGMRGADVKSTRRARSLRQRSTRAEWVLWLALRDRRLGGLKFARQQPLGPYYADFVCREQQLIIEVDGGQHADSASDRRRDAYLNSLGYRVVRA